MRSRPSLVGLLAAALSGAVAVLYLGLIRQGLVGVAGDEGRVAIVVLIFVAQTVLATAGALRRSIPLLAIAAAMLLATGFLALFSIGLPLLVAALLAGVAAAREAGARRG